MVAGGPSRLLEPPTVIAEIVEMGHGSAREGLALLSSRGIARLDIRSSGATPHKLRQALLWGEVDNCRHGGFHDGVVFRDSGFAATAVGFSGWTSSMLRNPLESVWSFDSEVVPVSSLLESNEAPTGQNEPVKGVDELMPIPYAIRTDDLGGQCEEIEPVVMWAVPG